MGEEGRVTGWEEYGEGTTATRICPAAMSTAPPPVFFCFFLITAHGRLGKENELEIKAAL